MTTQTPDLFQYRGIEYFVVGVSNQRLFNPSTLGLELASPSTSCARGYQAVFGIEDLHLVLNTLCVAFPKFTCGQHAQRGLGPVINGIQPSIPVTISEGFDSQYDGLQLHLDYSGGLLIGGGLIPKLLLPLCEPFPWYYSDVWELIFYRGIVVEVFDRGKVVAEIRQLAGNPRTRDEEQHYLSGRQFDRFVQRAFAEDYWT